MAKKSKGTTGSQFNIDSTCYCGVCKCDIKIGLGGKANWNAHTMSTSHCKCEREAKIVTKNISSFFVKAPPRLAVSPAAETLLLSQPPCPRMPPENRASHDVIDLGTFYDSMVETSSLLTELARVVQTLPPSIDLAVPSDALAAYSDNPHLELDAEDDPWEMIDRALNRTLGYGKTTPKITLIIRQGPLGMDRMINWL
ncbi:hypothetical protein B0H34DRAFT_674037 [Crassisporium funariophilum]|nr:hypothetical protein B0H34DRAFT_674037 [Crassisporium funariophilum]